MIEIHPQSHGKIIGLTIDGKLLKEDYKTVIPQLEQMIAEHGAIRCLIEVTGMKGSELGAFWQEIKFDTKHYKNIERCAVVGDPSWHQWMTKLGKLIFRKAKVQYFEPEKIEQAWEWLDLGTEPFEKQCDQQEEQQEKQQEEQQAETVGSSSSCICEQ